MSFVSKFEEFRLTSSAFKEGDKFDKERSMASSILRSLVEDKKEKVFIRFILTRENRGQMSENLFKVLRIANFMLTNEKGYFYKKLMEETGEKFMLANTLPQVLITPDSGIDMVQGFENDIKLHNVTIELVPFVDFEKEDIGVVSLSAKEDSRSAGKTASRTLRTLVNDEKTALLRYVRTKNNSLVISEKVFSLQKIMLRMSQEPASEIDNDLPNARIGYEVSAYGPFVSRVPLETKDGIVEGRFVIVHKIYFKLK